MKDSQKNTRWHIATSVSPERAYASRMSEHPEGVIKCFCSIVLLAAISLSISCFARAQILNVGDDTSTPIPGAGHDYIHSPAETVNPANGSVSIRIKTFMPEARGITLPFSLTYDSNGIWSLTPEPYNSAEGQQPGLGWALNELSEIAPIGGWGYGLPLLTLSDFILPCEGNTGQSEQDTSSYVFQAPDGSRHSFRLASSNGVCSDPTYGESGDSRYTAELVGIGQCFNCYTYNPPVIVSDADGTVYHFPGPMMLLSPQNNNAAGSIPDYIEDRNGNRIVTSESSNSFTVADTAGRPILTLPFIEDNTTTVITSGGQSYTVTWEAITTESTTIQTQQVFSESGVSCSAIPQIPASSMWVVKSIKLPDGTYYSFYYNAQGLLDEIDYPRGGWVKYAWKMSDQLADWIQYDGSSYTPQTNITRYYINACQFRYSVPVIGTRTVGENGSSAPLQTQTFTYSTQWDPNTVGWLSKQTTVETTDNVAGKSFEAIYTYSPIGVPRMPSPYGSEWSKSSQLPVESEVQYYNWGSNSSPLRTVTKTWNNQFDLTDQEVTLNGVLSSNTTYTYDYPDYISQIAEVDRYDYGQSTPTLRTVTSYQSFSGTLGTIEDKACKTISYDSSNNRIAEADFYYDGQTSPCGAPSVPSVSSVGDLPPGTHDESSFSANSTTPRANLTKAVHWSNSGASPIITFSYDETGQVVSTTSPCGNDSCTDVSGNSQITKYSYSDAYSVGSPTGNTNAYLTQVIFPAANNVSHIESYTYNYNNGMLTGATDENQRSTTYAYNDSLDRLTDIWGPASPQNGNTRPHTQFVYTDGPGSTVTETGPAGLVVESLEDGFGRVIRKETTSDSGGTDIVDTTYDGMGNISSISNPYRTAGDPTYGIAKFYYDPLGRKTSQIDSDGSGTQSWSYSENSVLHTDEDGDQWKSTIDAFGRLTQVLEPNGSSTAPTMETDYSYDALGNLLEVDQWGGSSGNSGDRKRIFLYNSLSELTNACNPEAIPSGDTCGSSGPWSQSYTYDADGNVLSKTDARGLTTNYVYDALNRVLQKSYSDGTASDPTGTPWSCYQYDTSSISGAGGNLIGRLTNEWTQKAGTSCATAPPTGGYITLKSELAYDPMGRLLTEEQCTPGNCTTTTPYKMSYTYDLAGDLASSTNGLANTPGASGAPLTFTYNWNGAEWLQGVTSNWSSTNAAYPSQLMSVQSFVPTGAVSAMTYGNGLTLNRTYDNRLRITGETDTGGVRANATPGTATIEITGTEQN